MLWRFFLCLLVVQFSTPAAVHAAKPRMVNDKDGNAVPWKEAKTTLPGYPEDENLMQIQAPPGARNNRYFVDTRSLSLGPDLVLRYTVVIMPRGGSTANVLFQGISCETNEVKTYAFGRTNGTFATQTSGTWRPVQRTGPMGYQNELIDKYVCDETSSPIGAEDVRLRLREGGQPYNAIWTDDGASQ